MAVEGKTKMEDNGDYGGNRTVIDNDFVRLDAKCISCNVQTKCLLVVHRYYHSIHITVHFIFRFLLYTIFNHFCHVNYLHRFPE